MSNELKQHSKTPEQVTSIKETMIKLEMKVDTLEHDVNNLWAFARTDDPRKLFDNMRSKPRNKDDG
jgi:glutaredoxin-related protein